LEEKMKQVIIALLLIMTASAWAQVPVVDGIPGTQEYARTETKAGITVAAGLF
jgi:hypothetical protein